MEVTLDLGKDSLVELNKIAQEEKKEFDVVALEMISLGTRVRRASKESKQDKQTLMLLKNTINTNELLKEVLTLVFDKDRSRLMAYDAETAIRMVDQFTSKYMQGADEL